MPLIAKVGIGAAVVGLVAYMMKQSKKPSSSRRFRSASDNGSLYARIARALGWPIADVRSMSLHSLRDLVRPVDRALADEISDAIHSGRYILGEGRGSGIDGTVENFLAVLSSKLTQYDERVSRRERMPNIYRLGHYMKALGDVRDKVAGILERSDPEALTALKAVINRHFHDLPPTNNVLKQIDAWLASGKRPSLVR
jgi:hypothetical protein